EARAPAASESGAGDARVRGRVALRERPGPARAVHAGGAPRGGEGDRGASAGALHGDLGAAGRRVAGERDLLRAPHRGLRTRVGAGGLVPVAQKKRTSPTSGTSPARPPRVHSSRSASRPSSPMSTVSSFTYMRTNSRAVSRGTP